MERPAQNPIQVLEDALEMEEEGKAFFGKVSQMMKHPRTRDTFISLARQEEKHISVLRRELDLLKLGKNWISLEEAKSSAVSRAKISVFKDRDLRRIRLRPESSELEAFEIGIEVERRSIDYYRTAGRQTENAKAKEVFHWLVGEETGHLTILSAERDYRAKSGFYYGEPEFSLEVM